MLKINSLAPDFTATLSSGEQFTLSENKGTNIILYFYPRAFTYGCTIETKSFGDAYEEIKSLNGIVVGISADEVGTLDQFATSCYSPFELASDSTGEIRKLYDVQRKFNLGTSRVTNVIDTNGVIQNVINNEVLMNIHVTASLKALRELDTGTIKA